MRVTNREHLLFCFFVCLSNSLVVASFSSSAFPSRSPSSSPRVKGDAGKILRDDTYEEKDRKEMEWLVKSTSQLLGDAAPPPGFLSRTVIRRADVVMKAWARRSPKTGSEAPHVVERLLMRIIDEREAGNAQARASTATYNIVIDAWSRSRDEGAAQRAEDILDGMEEACEKGNYDVIPNTDSYNGVIKAWVKNGRPNQAVGKAEGVLERMKRRDVSPNLRTYNLILYALANSLEKDAASRAEEILSFLERKSATGNGEVKPDINSFHQVIAAWAKSRDERSAHRAQAIFDRLVRNSNTTGVAPDTDTFNALIGCWYKSKDPLALQRVEEVLNLMDESYRSGNSEAKPDTFSVNTVISAFSKFPERYGLEKGKELLGAMEDRYGVVPDVVGYNVLIDGWSKSGRTEAPQRALELLCQMETKFKDGNTALMPDAFTFTSVIDTISKSQWKDAGKRADAVLDKMEELHRSEGGPSPTTAVYNAVLNAWASSKASGSVKRAESILQHMEHSCAAGNQKVRPNIRTYNTVLKSFLHSRGSHTVRAELLLTRLENMAAANSGIYPDRYSYTTVINIHGKSREKEKARKAQLVLLRMIDSFKAGNSGAKPNVYAFNACINACAFTFAKRDKVNAFVIAVSTLLMVEKYGKPNHLTYGTFLRACSNLMAAGDERRDRVVRTVFAKCCRDGQVTPMVIDQLRFAASHDLFQRLVGDLITHGTNVEIPSQWRSNVCDKNK